MPKVDKHKLCELLDTGISNQSQLAKELGCSRQYVNQLVHGGNYQRKGGGRVQRRVDEILELRQQRKTYKQIAEELGISLCSVANLLQMIRRNYDKSRVD